MQNLIIILSIFSSVAFAGPAASVAPAGQKIHKEIKSGQIVVPAPVSAKPASADKTKIKK